MMLLTSATTISMSQIFWILMIVGITTGLASVVFISILMSWSMKDTLDHSLKLVIFAIIISASVYATGNLIVNTTRVSQAAVTQQILAWNVSVLPDGRSQISFRTPSPARVYLEYKTPTGDMIPVFSSQSTAKVSDHYFVTDNVVPVGSKVMVVVIDGKRYHPDQSGANL